MARTHVLIAAVLFGTTGTAQALGPGVEPLAVGSARILVGAALLTAVAVAAARSAAKAAGPAAGGLRESLGAGDRRLFLLAGVFVAAYQASFFAAVADTGVAVGTVVALGSAPAFTGLFGRLFAHERLEPRWFAATALACAGVCLLTLGGGSAGDVSAPGIALALVAGAGYAGYAVIGKHLLHRGGTPEGVMAAVFGTGAIMLLPVLAVTPTGELVSAGGLTLAVYLGAVTTAVAYILFAKGLSRIGASETATLTLAEPVTAMALGFLVLGERPGALAVAGAALVLAGLAVLAVRFERGFGRRIAGRVAAYGPDQDSRASHGPGHGRGQVGGEAAA
jgi:drug/metabolite transporter, DME family